MPKGYRKIPGVNENWRISRTGKVIRLKDGEWIDVTPKPKENGYPRVYVGEKTSGGNYKTALLHRLVALTFLYDPNDPQPFKSYEVHHLDHDRNNARADNLVLCTHQEHVIYHQIESEFMKFAVKTKKFKDYQKIRFAELSQDL